MSAIAKSSARMFAHAATLARKGMRNEGTGGATVARSYDLPKKATRRRATTPRISNSENSTRERSSTSAASSSVVTKSSR